MFQFLHAADLHLDTPFEGLRRLNANVADALREASLDAFDALIDLAITRDVRFVVFAGDIYDGAERGVRAQLRFRDGLKRLSEHGIWSFVVHGNHDPLDGWSAVRDWPDRVMIFGADDVGSVGIDYDGRRLATIYGMSYPTRDVSENLALRYRRDDAPGLHVGVLHCNVGGNADHASYSPCSLDDLAATRMDYWALGHIHGFSTRERDGSWMVYSGTLQGRSTKRSEQGEKGVVLVTAEDRSVVSTEFVALDRARFLELTVDIALSPDLPSVLDALRAAADALRQEHGDRLLLVRAFLTGRGPTHADLAGAGRLDECLEQLRQDAGAHQPLLWWEDLRSATLPDLDLDEIRGRGDFSADVLGVAAALAANDQALDALIADRLDSVLTGHIRRRVPESLSPMHNADLLQEASILAIDLLERPN